MAKGKRSKKKNTGIRISEFLREYLPNIVKLTKEPSGGYSLDEMKVLWNEGLMPGGKLRHFGKKMKYKIKGNTKNYDLLASMKNEREELLKKLSEDPKLDVFIEIRKRGTGIASMKSGLLE